MKNHNIKALLIPAVVSALASCNGTSDQQKPNIVIFLADDMGWGDINANGNELISTPVLNSLKSESLSFDRFYVCPQQYLQACAHKERYTAL